MFDFVRSHTRILQFVLVLLIFPSFVFFGIQGYSRFTEGGNATVAKVDGQPVTQAEWDAAHRNQTDRLRQRAPGMDPKFFDSPEMKWQTLDGLVRERVIFAAADHLHLLSSVSDQRLLDVLRTAPELAPVRDKDGNVDRALYTQLLASQGMSPEQFESRLRQDTGLRQVTGPLQASAIAPPAVANAAFDALLQQREVQVQRFDTKDYLAKVNPSDADIEAFYKANATQFQAPEQADIEYVVLDADVLKKAVTVSEDDLKNYYESNKARFTVAQERRASHILVKVAKDAPAADRAKAKAKAEALLAEVRKNPASFADVAKKNSDDTGSAAQGGDLDFFKKGDMTGPFEAAAFAMKPGEISNVVETDFGYHIIKLTEVRGGDVTPYEKVRAQIEDELRKQEAQKKFAESAGDFSDMVYQQFDSLKPAADKFKLEVRTATVGRTPAPDAKGPLASPKLLEAVFGNEALHNKRNTDAVEVAPGQMASARVVKYTPAHARPLAEVRDEVRKRVVQEQAAAAARKDGEARLAQLKGGGDASGLPAAVKVSRAQAGGLPRQVMDAVLRADASKLPATIGVDLADAGYAVVRLNQVLPRDPAAVDQATAQAQYAQAWSAAETLAYYEALKARYKVQIKAAAPSASSVGQ